MIVIMRVVFSMQNIVLVKISKIMKLWIKLQHWFYRILIDYKTKKIIEFNKEREKYLKNK